MQRNTQTRTPAPGRAVQVAQLVLEELRQIKNLLAFQLLEEDAGKQENITRLHRAGLPNSSIASVVGTTADAVRARLSEAKKKQSAK
ncbi:hypothetical protein CH330_03855 [candidate division WOR-3 bacterium JGI_Cruoil_03_51_56]|uniref:RNA polymerase sigma factor 70 region 4 type 2 domain-containing protein n=1 Tax=candidate division WOR-3 bacterium JGI_Cruoil_03_51_56 TaxID=1973747 RepID=A0A235BU94_UNCW3|nr:MAG: hypothetical protein CH330_03855 [candidate division WOR-3 bacterium JGI_Cruoil_03_51_56]